MSDLFWSPTKEEVLKPKYKAAAEMMDNRLADLWKAQVDAHDAIPQHYPPRYDIRFSPSGATKCLRELYYANTNAPQDEEPANPWKRRMARNGTSYHDGIQADFNRMEEKLREAGLDVYFVPVEWELKGKKTYTVEIDGKPYDVTFSGRCDGMLRYIGPTIPGLIETGDIILLEFKSKDKLTNLKKIVKFGVQEDHRAQVVCYSLIWGIDTALVHYEALQKPKWSEPADSVDWAVFQVIVTELEQQALLNRLAQVVKAIHEEKLPEPELSKCGFCPFKGQCAKDGGYRG